MRRKGILLSAVLSLSLYNVNMCADGIKVDTNAPNEHQATLDKARNGVDVVNITTPNQNGISHNTFLDFNVPKPGVILNNSRNSAKSKLSGWIVGNEHIKQNPASLILNEVSGTKRTMMNGMLEVAGKSADVIVANPNGITVNGGGFINIPKATLTTGEVSFERANPHFGVYKGDISVEGDGVYAKGVKELNFYTEKMKLNSKIYANKLNITLGKNYIDQNGMDQKSMVFPMKGNKAQKGLLLDSSKLGGIYANSISLVGTTNGMGVKLPPEVMSQGSLKVTNEGEIIIDRAKAKDDAQFNSKNSNISVQNGVYANTLNMNAKEKISLKGNSGALKRVDIKSKDFQNSGLLAVGVDEKFEKSGTGKDAQINLKKSNISIRNGVYANTQNMNSKGNGKLIGNIPALRGKHHAVKGNKIKFKDFEKSDSAVMSIQVSNKFENNGKIYANGVAKISASKFYNGNHLSDDNDALISSDKLNISVSKFENDGKIKSGDLKIESQDYAINRGDIESSGDLSIGAKTLEEQGGKIVSMRNLALNIREDIVNSGTIHSNQDLNIKAKSLTNDYGDIEAIKSLALDIQESIVNKHAKIVGEGDVTLKSKILTNIDAIIVSAKNLTLDIKQKISNGIDSLFQSKDTLNISTEKLDNKGDITSDKDLNIKSKSVDNSGAIYSKGDLQIESDEIKNSKTIFSAHNLYLYIKNLFSNSGETVSKGKMTIAGGKNGEKTNLITNSDTGVIKSGGDMELNYNTLKNSDEKSIKKYTYTLKNTLKLDQKECLAPFGGDCYFTPNKEDIKRITKEVFNDSSTYKEAHGMRIPHIDQDALIKEIAKRLNKEYEKFGVHVSLKEKKIFKGFHQDNKSELVFVTDQKIENDISYLEFASNITVDGTSGSIGRTGEIYSGGKLTMNGNNLHNNYGRISSVKDMTLNVKHINNAQTKFYKHFDVTVTKHYSNKTWHLTHNKWKEEIKSKDETIELTDKELGGSIISGGKLSVTGDSIVNGKAPKQGLVSKKVFGDRSQNIQKIGKISRLDVSANINLPKGKYGIFIKNSDKKGPLIISNPKYNDYQEFINSEYLLKRLNYVSLDEVRRLGDGLYEMKLVSDAVMDITGQRFVNGAGDEEGQYIMLMDNAVDFAKEAGLKVGQKPNNTQLKKLKKDIVWLETKVVDGKKVLVPVVYLANHYQKGNGALINAKGMDINLKNDFQNSGKLNSNDDLILKAKSFTNSKGKVVAVNLLKVNVDGDFKNISGDVKGGSVDIKSKNGNIINTTTSKTIKFDTKNTKQTMTKMGDDATIEATKSDLLLKGKKVKMDGAKVKSKGFATLSGENGVEINALENKNSLYIKGGGGYHDQEHISHKSSEISSGGQTSIVSKNGDVKTQALKINSKDTLISAGGKVIDRAVVNSDFVDDVHHSSDLASKTKKKKSSLKESVQTSTISGNKVVIKGDKGVDIEATKIDAKVAIGVDSKEGKVKFRAKTYTKESSLYEKAKSYLGGLFSSSRKDTKEELRVKGSSQTAKSLIRIQGKSIEAEATNFKITDKNKGLLALIAKDDIDIQSAKETTTSTHKSKKKGLSLGISKNSITVAQEKKSSSYNKMTTQKKSKIESANVYLKSGKDTNLVATDLSAKTLTHETGGNFKVVNGKNTLESSNSKSTKKFGVDFKINTHESTIFAGYKEKGKKDVVKTEEVVQSNIKVGHLNSKAKDINIIGSNFSAQDAHIDAENFNIVDVQKKTTVDNYKTKTKAGLEVGVKQHLSDAIDRVKNIKNSKSGSGKVANAMKAYETISNFSAHPIDAGVNAVYTKEKQHSHTVASESVASDVHFQKLNLKTDSTLVKGSDLKVDDLTLDTKKFVLKAGKSTMHTKTGGSKVDGSVGLYGTKLGQVGVSKGKTEADNTLTVYRNANVKVNNMKVNVTDKTTIEGGNIDVKVINGSMGDLSIKNMENTQIVKQKSKGGYVSGGANGLGGIYAYSSKSTMKNSVVGKVSGINAEKSLNLTANKTELDGTYISNVDKNGKVLPNLHFHTNELILKDHKYKQTSKSNSIGFGTNSIDRSKGSTNQTETIKATITDGEIDSKNTIGSLNRDIDKMRETSKKSHKNSTMHLSKQDIALIKDPSKEIQRVKGNLKDVGLAAHVEILKNLPSASKVGDGKGDMIDKTVGKALDKLNGYTLGLSPAAETDGGVVKQIATQFFGDNRLMITAHSKEKLLKMGISPRDIKKVDLVLTKDGVKRAQDVKNKNDIKDRLPSLWITDPDKKVVIGKRGSVAGNKALEPYKIYVDENKLKEAHINHIFTNGMFNSPTTAVYNQQTQQGNVDGMLNYNQQSGIVGDLLESGQDHIAANFTKGALPTGGSRQTAELIKNMNKITKADMTITAHSQGTLMSQNGLYLAKDILKDTLKENKDSRLEVSFNGAPVNHKRTEELVTDIYGGEENFQAHNIKKISDVSRTHVAPEDAVGTVLGFQSAGINNSEKLGNNIKKATMAVPDLFGYGDPSPHSYYPCVMGCGEDRHTPNKGFYYDPVTKSDRSLIEWYKENIPQRDITLLPKEMLGMN